MEVMRLADRENRGDGGNGPTQRRRATEKTLVHTIISVAPFLCVIPLTPSSLIPCPGVLSCRAVNHLYFEITSLNRDDSEPRLAGCRGPRHRAPNRAAACPVTRGTRMVARRACRARGDQPRHVVEARTLGAESHGRDAGQTLHRLWLDPLPPHGRSRDPAAESCGCG